MTKALYIQIIFLFTAFFSFLLLIYFLFYKREKNIQKSATMQVIGEVVKHSYLNGSDLAALPVVEYVVDGERYQKRFSYSTFETTTSTKAKADVFDTKFIRSPYHVLDLKNMFPIGSKMTVWCNPQKPKQGFVERYPGHDRILRLHIIIFGTLYILLIVIVTFFYVM